MSGNLVPSLAIGIISQDPSHRDSEPDLVFEDMTVMSDFELHSLCLEEKVKLYVLCEML